MVSVTSKPHAQTITGGGEVAAPTAVIPVPGQGTNREPDGWVRGPKQPVALASELGLLGLGEERARLHAGQRRQYREWLASRELADALIEGIVTDHEGALVNV